MLLGRILDQQLFRRRYFNHLLLDFVICGMTFQIVAAICRFIKTKTFAIHSENYQVCRFDGVCRCSDIFFNKELQELFHTKTATMFVILVLDPTSIFLMSINRGLYQGQNIMDKLAFTPIKLKWPADYC
jgi:hypothetical protein